MKLHSHWLVWQVFVPLAGPIVLSELFILAWMTGNPDFRPDPRIVLDVSPWAMTFYTIGLVGAAINGLWSKLSACPQLGGTLIAIALTVATYSAFMVIWRHQAGFVPGRIVYLVSTFLLAVAVAVCHHAYAMQQVDEK